MNSAVITINLIRHRQIKNNVNCYNAFIALIDLTFTFPQHSSISSIFRKAESHCIS